MQNVVLASSSPRRLELFRRLGRVFSVDVPNIDETPKPRERPESLVRRLAVSKAIAVGRRHPEAVTLAADTTVSLYGEILGKPRDPEEAVAMLSRLNGQKHQVYTGVAVWRDGEGRGYARTELAQVTFGRISAEEIEAYVTTGDPLDKAGGYGIQGRPGNWVQAFEGNLETVIGLPMDVVERLLAHWK